MVKYSIIIPVYNRPEEVDELLASLTRQTKTDFEVLIVEDGSTISCKEVVLKYSQKLAISYYIKENSGQGFSRNYATQFAKSDWLIFFDSDCIIPSQYIENLRDLIQHSDASAFCGPDAARADFSPLQRAISYAMTSFLTTGGIRGSKRKADGGTQLRSYNLVMKKQTFDDLGGFAKTNMGEDMELSHRFKIAGHRSIISDALKVYHKRRNTLRSFYKQVYSFGRTRIQLKRGYGIPIKLPHLFPGLFTTGLVLIAIGILVIPKYATFLTAFYAFYFVLILLHSTLTERSLKVGFLALISAFIQHLAYGLGFISEVILSKKS